MARRRIAKDGQQWIRLKERPNQAPGDAVLYYTKRDGSKPYQPAAVSTNHWTLHAAETVDDLRADPILSAFLEFASTNPEEI